MRDANSPKGGTRGTFQKCHIGAAGTGLAGGTVKWAAFISHRIDTEYGCAMLTQLRVARLAHFKSAT